LLEREVQMLGAQLQQLGDALQRPESEEAPPPHY